MYMLEMRSTENWMDVRYRAYTTSEKKAEAFKTKVTKIKFTDSGHGVVTVVTEVRSKHLPLIHAVSDHVKSCMAGEK